jgi:transcriptional regulator with XRE-family HTH domain
MKKRAAHKKHSSELRIRELLGISQEEYAAFFGVSPSMLSMIEINKRNWPGMGDNDMTVAYKEAENDPAPLSIPMELTPEKISDLEIVFLTLKRDLFKNEQGLKKTTFGQQQCERRLKTCARLREKYTDPQSLQVKLINVWERTAQIKLFEEKLPVELELEEIQLEAVRKQMAVLEKWLKKE